MSAILGPNGKPMNPKLYQRHVCIDSRHKEILIQVMLCGPGDHRVDEYLNIKAGQYHEYIPAEIRGVVNDMVLNGYKVVPIHIDFGAQKKDFYLLQYSELHAEQKSPIPYMAT